MSEYEPITGELRAALDVDREFMRADGTVVAQTFCVDRGDFERLCDAIDAVHAGLERENAELRERVAVLDNERGNMHDGGSITGELRGWYKDRMFMGNGWQELDNIADRIDAEHEKQCAESWMRGHDAWAAIDRSDEMAEHGWIRMPLDADGVPIRIGDVMDSKVDYLFDGKPFTVRALVLCEDGWEAADGRFGNRYEPNSLHHHHAPTVEDVLREMADRCYADEDEPRDRDAIVAEYAKRLTLAEGEDE